MAFAVQAVGYNGAYPLLGASACKGNSLTLFFVVTLAGWLVLSDV
jgi:hypothetical protein